MMRKPAAIFGFTSTKHTESV